MKLLYSKTPALLLTLIVGLITTPAAFGAATIAIQNNDAPNVGFNDPTPAAPVGGNNGTTVGQQRLIAFQFAADIWGATLSSGPTITVRASWPALECTADSAVLGAAGALSTFRNFPGAPFPNTLYSVALANALANSDLNGPTPEIVAQFNNNLGKPGCLETTHWYYGLDANEDTGGIDLVAVLLHELGHGLGFQSFTNESSGAQSSGFPSIYDRFLFDNTQQKTWPQMTNAERAASAVNTGNLVWIGQQVSNDVPGMLVTPRLRVNAPSSIARDYVVGPAGFGARLTAAGVTGGVVQALDPSNSAGSATTDACSPLTNGSAVSGKIALVDRGTCPFITKVKNAQNAGAVAVIVVDNTSDSPPAGLGGSDSTISIPSVRITRADGDTIKAQLASGVNATLLVDPSVPGGADSLGRPLMFAPKPVDGGSSISHWDRSLFPNQLMEPNLNGDLTHSIVAPQDLSFALMRDIGWCVGCPKQNDPPPPNDDFVNAQILNGTQGSVSGTNVGATKETGEPNHAGNAGGASVWYRWQAPATQSATLTTSGSNFATVLAVYTGPSVNSLTPITSTLQSAVTFKAQAGVVYNFAVDGNNGATGSIVFGWNQLPPNNERGPMTNGATHTGVIGVGQVDEWSFQAAQNDGITINIGEVLTGVDPNFVPWIRLLGPDGALLDDDWNSRVAWIDLRAPQTGTYTLLVASNTGSQNGPGSYVLTLAKTPGPYTISAGDEGGPITNGVTHTGVIGVGDLDTWTFQAVQNDGITINIGEVLTGVDPNFIPWIRLRAPDGALLDDDWNSRVAWIDLRAPQTGTYTLLVASNTIGQNGPGSYQLTLAKTPGPYTVSAGDEGGPITNGVTHTGVIGVGDLDTWTFQAAQNDGITINIGEVLTGVDPNFIPWIRLRAPDGLLLDDDWNSRVAWIDLRAPQTGTYTLLVASNTISQNGPGSYQLTLAKTPGPYTVSAGDEGGPITNSVTHTGVIGVGDLDTWTFQAVQNDGITINIGEVLTGVDPNFIPWIRLRAPDGLLLDDDWNSRVAWIDLRAPQTGTYTLLVASNTISQNGPGSYQLTLAKTPGPYSISSGDEGGPMLSGATHTGVIGIGDLDAWTFQAIQNDAISISIDEVISGVDPNFIPWIRLRGPNGLLLDDDWASLSAKVDLRAPQTGTYTLLVASNTISQNGPGGYLLRLMGPAPTPPELILDTSGAALALDSLLMFRDPFPVVNGGHFLNTGADRNTRVILFVVNLPLVQGETSASFVVNLIDSNSQNYDVAAEDVRFVPNFPFTQVIFRLPDNLSVGTCTIKIKAHGQISNAGTMRIKI